MVAESIKPGYKQTEVGIIPEDWDVKRLNDLVIFSNGVAHESIITKNGDYVVVNSKFVSSNGLIRKYSQFCLCSVYLNEILMVMSDVPNGKAIAKCFLVDRNNLYTLNQRICALKSKESNPQFLFYKLDRNPYFLGFDDGVKQTNLRKKEILDCNLAIPKCYEEQSAIAEVLSDTDLLIESLGELIEKKKNIKQGAMQELLTGKRRLLGFKEDWEDKRLGDLLIYEQPIKYIVKSNKYNDSFDIPVLTANKAFILGYTNEKDGVFNNLPVIIFDDFTLDNKFVTFNFKVKSSAIKILKLKNNCSDLKFIFERMQLINHPIGDHKRYYISEYQDQIVIFPKKEEQFAIAEILSDMDSEIDHLEKERDKYKQIKTGMMQELLTGSIRLI